MERFLDGNENIRGQFLSSSKAYLRKLAKKGQTPEAVFIGCSDSRVIPELLTGAMPGELFVIRNVANLIPAFENVDSSVGAALEYAVGALKTRNIIVCGHYGCGGVHAILDEAHHALDAMPSVKEWLENARPAVAGLQASDAPMEERWRRAVEQNVLHQLSNLATYPLLRPLLEAGELSLHGWVYDLYTAGLSVYDPDAHAFVPAGDLQHDG